MPGNDYRFVSRWRVEGSPQVVFDILDDALDYPRWWPSVWLEAEVIEQGSADGTHRTIRFLSRGKLPYTLRWTARRIETTPPARIVIRAANHRWAMARGEESLHRELARRAAR